MGSFGSIHTLVGNTVFYTVSSWQKDAEGAKITDTEGTPKLTSGSGAGSTEYQRERKGPFPPRADAPVHPRGNTELFTYKFPKMASACPGPWKHWSPPPCLLASLRRVGLQVLTSRSIPGCCPHDADKAQALVGTGRTRAGAPDLLAYSLRLDRQGCLVMPRVREMSTLAQAGEQPQSFLYSQPQQQVFGLLLRGS